MIWHSRRAFTVVELVIVIVVIAILATIVTVAYNGVTRSALEASMQSDLNTASTELTSALWKRGAYPADASVLNDGQGLKASGDNVLAYTKYANGYCISVTNPGTPTVFSRSSSLNKTVKSACGEGSSPTDPSDPEGPGPGVIASATDDFNRTGPSLASVPGLELPWQELSGSWTTNGSIATSATAVAQNPMAVIDFATGDVDLSVDVSSAGGGDALIFRANDANNYWRLGYYHDLTTSTSPVVTHCAVGAWGAWGSWAQGDRATSYSSATTYHGYCDGDHTYETQYSGSGPCPPGRPGMCYIERTRSRPEYKYTTGGGTLQTHTYRLQLQKVTGGTVTTVNTFTTSATSRLRVVANGSEIAVYRNSETSPIGTVADSALQGVTKHGIGRYTGGNQTSSGIDNFAISRL